MNIPVLPCPPHLPHTVNLLCSTSSRVLVEVVPTDITLLPSNCSVFLRLLPFQSLWCILKMHLVVLDVIHLDRSKGSDADMKCYVCDFNAFFPYLLKQFFCKWRPAVGAADPSTLPYIRSSISLPSSFPVSRSMCWCGSGIPTPFRGALQIYLLFELWLYVFSFSLSLKPKMFALKLVPHLEPQYRLP